MSDALFNCPHCEQEIEAPADMAGASVSCPNCDNTITVPGGSKKKVVVKKRGGAKNITRSSSPASGATATASPKIAVPKKKASLTVTADKDYTQPPSSAPAASSQHNDFMPQQVIVSDIQITFGRMVILILKWSLASIPAMIILWIIIAVTMMAFGGLIAGLVASVGP